MSINRVMAEKMFELFNAISYMIDKKKLKLYCLNRKKSLKLLFHEEKKVQKCVLYDLILVA